MATETKTIRLIDINLSAFLVHRGIEPLLEAVAGRVVFAFQATDELYRQMNEYNEDVSVPVATSLKVIRNFAQLLTQLLTRWYTLHGQPPTSTDVSIFYMCLPKVHFHFTSILPETPHEYLDPRGFESRRRHHKIGTGGNPRISACAFFVVGIGSGSHARFQKKGSSSVQPCCDKHGTSTEAVARGRVGND